MEETYVIGVHPEKIKGNTISYVTVASEKLQSKEICANGM